MRGLIFEVFDQLIHQPGDFHENMERLFTYNEVVQQEFLQSCIKKKLCCHGKRKIVCKYCGGSGLCCHFKRKDYCIDCKGSQICKHKKHKNKCPTCNKKVYCEHGIARNKCLEC